MPEFSPEARIKASIQPGSVYYFPDEELSSPEPHYFIVLNHNPSDDMVLLLVCSSSQIEKVKRRRSGLPGTCIEIVMSDYKDFTVDSIVDCNNVFKRSINHLVNKLTSGDLKIKSEMNFAIVQRLRSAVLNSTLVSREDKQMLIVE
ncbi:MAG: hypothetical protein Q7J65_00080 [Candidatus Marinimicrobia bacterium]|nr:hypothetical protein [Candidatus Neomarinimicrobiota bacterium]